MAGIRRVAEHKSVLLTEAVDALITDRDACYVDGTFGRGGHSRLILQKLSTKGRLLAFDKDPQAISEARDLAVEDKRFSIVHGSFTQLDQELKDRQWSQLGGVLLDLGVSSPQLDQADRGFSFQQDGPLDMRMDCSKGLSVAEWLTDAEEADIASVLWTYGEERFSRRMAKAIVKHREIEPIVRTKQLADIVASAHPAWERHKHPATRAFQALRIYINDELEDLSSALEKSVGGLAVGGRLVVISFHSLEDRLVKRFFRDQSRGHQLPKHLPVVATEEGKTLTLVGKAFRASKAELEHNPRARSAVMRVAERL